MDELENCCPYCCAPIGIIVECHPFSSDAGAYYVCTVCDARFEPYEYEELTGGSAQQKPEVLRRPRKDLLSRNKRLEAENEQRCGEMNVMRSELIQLDAKNKRLKYAVGLLNSMVLSGEEHSEESKKVVTQALKDNG